MRGCEFMDRCNSWLDQHFYRWVPSEKSPARDFYISRVGWWAEGSQVWCCFCFDIHRLFVHNLTFGKLYMWKSNELSRAGRAKCCCGIGFGHNVDRHYARRTNGRGNFQGRLWWFRVTRDQIWYGQSYWCLSVDLNLLPIKREKNDIC